MAPSVLIKLKNYIFASRCACYLASCNVHELVGSVNNQETLNLLWTVAEIKKYIHIKNFKNTDPLSIYTHKLCFELISQVEWDIGRE